MKTQRVSIGRDITAVHAWLLANLETENGLADRSGVSRATVQIAKIGPNWNVDQQYVGESSAEKLAITTGLPRVVIMDGELKIEWLVPVVEPAVEDSVL